jgi:hypothetical protein
MIVLCRTYKNDTGKSLFILTEAKELKRSYNYEISLRSE